MKRAKHRSNRKGVSMVELALVLPLLSLLSLGIIEFGRAFWVMQVLTNAAREGARVGALRDRDSSAVRNRVEGLLDDVSLPTDERLVVTAQADDSLSLANAEAGEGVSVYVGVNYADVSFLSPRFLSGVQLGAQSVMRRE